MREERYLVVTADDFGIGPATSQGILDLALARRITCTVLLTNSPYAEEAVRAWRSAGEPCEVGWHPCLTLDDPILPISAVPSLVDGQGRFWSLGAFLKRLWLGQIQATEMELELTAQLERYVEFFGFPPTVVNAHHHLQVFPQVGRILRSVLAACKPLPYLRNVRESSRTLRLVPGGRLKRWMLSRFGEREARRQQSDGFPGNDWLVGITDPEWVADPRFFVRWLRQTPGRTVELTCHPGHWDKTLVGRDCPTEDAQLRRRPYELRWLKEPSFPKACEEAGFKFVSPWELHHGMRMQNQLKQRKTG